MEKMKKDLREVNRKISRVKSLDRKAETRKKIIIGSYYMNKYTMEQITAELDGYLTSKWDRELFDLPVEKGDDL